LSVANRFVEVAVGGASFVAAIARAVLGNFPKVGKALDQVVWVDVTKAE
jgi:hypothetical protein